jgi:acid phosphatase
MKLRIHRSWFFVSALLAVVTSNVCAVKDHRRLAHFVQNEDKETIQNYYESGLYNSDVDKIVDRAITYFDGVAVQDKAVVIFDVDDTALSNYAVLKSMDFTFIRSAFHAQLVAAEFPAVQPVKRLYDYLVARGFRIVFLTGRAGLEHDVTIKNLHAQGFTQFEKLIVRQPGQEGLATGEYKVHHRKALVEQGYTVVASVGDQWCDVTGEHAGHGIKLPNYMYSFL